MAGLVFDSTLEANWRAFQAGDLPASGVTAGTYGDSTHVSQVTVDAKGRVTAAANVAVSAASNITTIDSPGGTIAVTNPSGPTADLDLPASGVAAATYGSATQVAQIAVNAEGIVTSASNVSVSGISGTGLVKLYDSTLAAAAASLDTGAGGIVGGHADLLIYMIVRTATAAATDTAVIRVNNDSGGNYYNTRVQNNNATLSGSSSVAQTSWGETIHGDGGGANIPTVIRLDIPSYDQTSFGKVAAIQAATPDGNVINNFTSARAGGWNSTAAITRIAITASSASNLKIGSRLVIYGMQ